MKPGDRDERDDEMTSAGEPATDPAGALPEDDLGWEASEVDDPGWEESDTGHTALPPRVEAWRRRSATGAILTGFALGLQQALETKREEPSIVAQTSGDPPRDLPVEAEFEFRRPRSSVVSIRPWLLDQAGAGQDTGGAGDSTAGAEAEEPGGWAGGRDAGEGGPPANGEGPVDSPGGEA